MNRIWNITKITTVSINLIFIILFLFNIEAFMFDFTSSLNFIFFALSTLFLFILEIKYDVKDKTINKKYDIAFILSQLIILFIILRNLFDPNLFLNFNNLTLYSNQLYNINSFFLINNYIYINALNFLLLLSLYINREN